MEDALVAEDGWVDVVADETSSLLAEDGLQLELVVFYDPVTEVLHAVGYDGAPARYFRAIESGPVGGAGDPGRENGAPEAVKER